MADQTTAWTWLAHSRRLGHVLRREVCEVALFERREKIGGPGKLVQIDESKIGKRKYHRGHVVEGQWVFGGIEEESRKCFINCHS